MANIGIHSFYRIVMYYCYAHHTSTAVSRSLARALYVPFTRSPAALGSPPDSRHDVAQSLCILIDGRRFAHFMFSSQLFLMLLILSLAPPLAHVDQPQQVAASL